ncbi:uncharacterized protein LOC128993608 [Macrosteles quadrilineatus]|uniref:uncharacterized protein LOC128993608 n=1 Tax=Macrosteles quadrilineatus TaxID=74068 RepID=UPI0023E121CD|nr:uncharacterized protein LOC128993608 [Macrosteles quadrilineatus]
MAQPPMQHHCKDCGLFFDSGKSLDVHLQYHKENLLSKWGNSSGEESNNNNVKPNKSPRVAAVPADSSDSVMDRFSPNFNFPVNRSTPPNSFNYSQSDMRPPSVGQDGSRPNSNYNPNAEPDYILGTGSGFPHRRSPTPTSPSPLVMQTTTSYRYRPYQQPVYTHQDQRNGGVSSSSPGLMANQQTSHQCEKCGYVCESPTSLLEHIQNSHPPSPHDNYGFNNDYIGQQELKNEPQAEILDLDSHKVHVYQPPQGEESSQNSQSSQLDPGIVPWMTSLQEKKLYHPMQMNGSGMPSPDFNVTTTTLNSPEIPHHQSYHYDHHINSPNQLPPQITSSQMPPLTKPSMPAMSKSSGNASWKSNEARRPKTYNCTACNKWFTSSGHLKRHYNTTLHKNAVKQSGGPDPANLPVSNHHHPPKDPAPPFIPHQDSPPNSQIEENQMMPVKMEDAAYDRHQHQLGNGNNFLSNPPNSLAGPSEVTGGLLLHSTQYPTGQEEMRVQHTLPHMQQHQNFLPFPGAPHPSYPQGMTMYPNLQPPHVSSIQQTVTNTTIGNLDTLEQTVDLHQIWGRNGELKNQLIALAKPTEQDPLPSFSHFAQNFGFAPSLASYNSAPRQESSVSEMNVGGLSPSQASGMESFYPSTSPAPGLNISNVHSIKKEILAPEDSNTLPLSEHGSYEESCSSPENMLPTSTEDDLEKPVMLEHVKIEDNYVSSTMTDRDAPITPQIRCIDCDKVFNKACYLTQHNKSFHTGERPFKCEICGKRFEVESQHLEHLGKHAGDKPYKCELCPKQFNHKTDLRRHMCHHSGEKPFCCGICGKGFIRKDHMVKHEETHRKKYSISRVYSLVENTSHKLGEPLSVNH